MNIKDTSFYYFNGVFYQVNSKFQEKGNKDLKTKFRRVIENISPAHLTIEDKGDKIKAEYVLDTVGKEKNADQN